MWILFTLMAAFMQAWRNAFQSKLSNSVSVAGVTLARFLYASPLAAFYLWSLYQWQDAPIADFNQGAAKFIIAAAVMQIIATGLMVKLFKLKNYAVGAGLAKSEALVAAILGMLFFGTHLSLLGWIGVLVGSAAVLMLSSKEGGWKSLSPHTVVIGLACGSAFALTSLWVREASLLLDVPFPHRAAWVLLLVILLQTIILSAYIFIFEKHTFPLLWKNSQLTVLISITSCIGSIGWFSAMSLQAVPYVKTLGQVEIFFMMLISSLWLKQSIEKKDMLGLVLIALAAVMVMWG